MTVRRPALWTALAAVTWAVAGCSAGPSGAEAGDCTTRPIPPTDAVESQQELDELLSGGLTGADTFELISCADDEAATQVVRVVPGVTLGEAVGNILENCDLLDD
ncbi:hypothetical protein TEK04_18455 [Klenkia sp. LSe6-5]|uniref:Uncharacterized protein n=1 Tax=Klenkia sesuvii TaxID=3103137 RepID=A0ABU8E095_9ACTN